MGYLFDGEGSTVTGQRIADMLAAFLGSGTYIASSLGNGMTATIKDNNTIRISDGACMQEGRMIIIEASTYDDFTIPNGTQGVKTTYYIGYLISTDSEGNESAETVVSTTKTASGSMRNGDSQMYVWLYSAVLDGLVLGNLTTLATKIGAVSSGLPGVTYGTTAPSNSDGMPNGSIYIQYS